MKKFLLDFVHRVLVACGIGPLVLAVVYLILRQTAGLETLTTAQVCTGILSLAVLAFLAGGMNAIYQVERLSLPVAILIHGCVLYLGYLAAYLVNDWLAAGLLPILVFTAVFVGGYLIIWAVIYVILRRSTARLNARLKKVQEG